jgi:hypothetical protein
MLYSDMYGPIEEFDWNSYKVKGRVHSGKGKSKKGEGKDIILLGEEIIEWKERHGHVLRKDMFISILDKDIEVLIIGKGVHGNIECPLDVKDFLLGHGIKEIVLENTPYACRLYNRYYKKGKKVAMVAHATC